MFNRSEQIQPSLAARKQTATKTVNPIAMSRSAALALALLAASTFGFSASSPASAAAQATTQQVQVMWHAQSGNTGPVADGAQATLQRTPDGIRYTIRTEGLMPNHAYSVWFVVVNDPAACPTSPCAPPFFIGDPSADGQVTFGKDGLVARGDGTGRFAARIKAGPLMEGWLKVQGLDDPMGAEVHLVLNDHGPVIAGMAKEMTSTYRAGCADTSPFPPFFSPSALADGTPGPNTCKLYQSAVFLPPD